MLGWNTTALLERLAAVARPRPTVPRILLAEDDRAMRQLLAVALRGEGYEVVEAEDGFELVDYLRCPPTVEGRSRRFDLVVSDIRMPILSGMDALKCMRDSDPTTPMILITAFGDPRTHAEARRLGANLVLDKPFQMEELKTAVRQALAQLKETGSGRVSVE